MIYGNRALEIYNESVRNDAEKIESEIINLYMHLIKFIYQDYKQSPSWIESIYKSYNNIIKKDITKNILKIIHADMNMIYKKAVNGAKADVKPAKINPPEKCEFDFDAILSGGIDYIKRMYLYPNARPDVVNDLDRILR